MPEIRFNPDEESRLQEIINHFDPETHTGMATLRERVTESEWTTLSDWIKKSLRFNVETKAVLRAIRDWAMDIGFKPSEGDLETWAEIQPWQLYGEAPNEIAEKFTIPWGTFEQHKELMNRMGDGPKTIEDWEKESRALGIPEHAGDNLLFIILGDMEKEAERMFFQDELTNA